MRQVLCTVSGARCVLSEHVGHLLSYLFSEHLLNTYCVPNTLLGAAGPTEAVRIHQCQYYLLYFLQVHSFAYYAFAVGVGLSSQDGTWVTHAPFMSTSSALTKLQWDTEGPHCLDHHVFSPSAGPGTWEMLHK